MSASVVTAFIAWKALHVWREQKHHELRIEIFANSRSAMGMISYLRNPRSFEGEITDEVLEERARINKSEPSPEELDYMIFLARAKRYFDEYNSLLNLRERIWAEYDEKHIFYRFYDYILVTNINIRNAHHGLMLLRDRRQFPEDQYYGERVKHGKIIVSVKGDEIETKMDSLFQELELERKKFSGHRKR